ncbi:MAG: F0F1 ATP synthase subunit A, partial [Candidatus Uhrbacteria bacterium]|nr:F0F1 ATP synthase subunit A [Candidatus Uhrbacteria bacterium]
LFHVGPIPITDGIAAAFSITIGCAILLPLLMRKAGVIPTRFQSAAEWMMESMLKMFSQAFGTEARARAFAPLLLSLMLFIGIANEFSIVPLVNQLVLDHEKLLRLPTADLSATLALAIIVIGLAHGIAFWISPLRHVGDFIKIRHFFHAKTANDWMQAVIELFLGPMELISEIAKVLSLSARLFGNIFAGEVMVVIITSLSAYTQFFVVWPINILGFLVGAVQAFVFTLLSTMFIANTVRPYLDLRDAKRGEGHVPATSSH